MEKLKIEYVPKEQLKPYENNAKIHPDYQIEQIKESIEKLGFNDPVAVWHDNVIIEGHGRLLAAMEMDSIKEIPVIRLDNLTDEERKAYALIHNKLTMNTGFDFEILQNELDDLANIDGLDLDLGDFGFDLGDIEPTQLLSEGKEMNIDDYSDDKFMCECPKCGFKFNPKE